MAKGVKAVFTILLIVVCAGAVYGLRTTMVRNSQSVTAEMPARMRGNMQAELKIVEYIDFQCPACANGAKILHQYLEKYPSQILLEVKYFPLAMHAHGMESAVYSECAAQQGKFWPYFDLLIEKQKQWAELIDANPALRWIGQEAGLNLGKLDACLKGEEAGKVVSRDMTEGQALGVQSTPTYFINRVMVVGTISLEKQLKEYFKENVASPPMSLNPSVK